uniref:Cytochrome b5 heme-binding domain-containing protein n=1 Tax=Caenorhabditis japonica TaxID=281687 RepID=A0A8R1HIZ2_CAEJA
MQLGEYDLTVTDVTVFVVFLVALKKVFARFLAPKIAEPRRYEIEPLEQRNLTLKEIENLRKEENRCLVVVNNKIYDLSSSRELYENNRDVFETENGCGEEWEPILNRKFQFVGKVVSTI